MNAQDPGELETYSRRVEHLGNWEQTNEMWCKVLACDLQVQVSGQQPDPLVDPSKEMLDSTYGWPTEHSLLKT